MSSIRLDIVTAERAVYAEDVDMVIAPGVEGQLGILPHHAPLMTTLQAGELRVKKGGEEVSLVISGGFLEVRPDKVVVLADAAERVEEIDVARAEEESAGLKSDWSRNVPLGLMRLKLKRRFSAHWLASG